METERIALSQEERDRLHLLRELERGELRQVAAAQRMKLTDRQVRRLLQRWREQGDRAVIHGLRGRPSNRKFAVSFQRKVLARVGQRYADSGFRFGKPRAKWKHTAKRLLIRFCTEVSKRPSCIRRTFDFETVPQAWPMF